MGTIKPQYIILVLLLLTLFWFGLPAWVIVQFIGASFILSSFGNHPWLVAMLLSSVLVGVSLLINNWLRDKVPVSLTYAYKAILIYFVIVFGSILPASYLINRELPSIRQVNFSDAAWKADLYTNNNFPKKVNMIESVKNHHLRVGMTRDELVGLLGDCAELKDECTINLGPQRDSIFPIDNSWLTLHFTDNTLTSFTEWSD